MANIRRGLERIGKALKVGGYLGSILFTAFLAIQLMRDKIDISEWTFGDADEFFQVGCFIWGPFLLFKLLFWIGDGFTDDDTNK